MIKTVEVVGISDFNVGDRFTGKLLIKSATKGIANNGNPYLSLILSDRTGSIEAKLWSITNEDEINFVSEKIIEVDGVISEFRGKTQLNINRIRLVNQEDVSLSQFLETAPIEKSVMMEKVFDTIKTIKNDNIRAITERIIKKYESDFSIFPAASKNHHAFVSGLAYHTISMLGIGKELCKLYPVLNKDLLYAGIILHDVGKVKEYTGIISAELTTPGKLLGHISIISEEIGITAKELGIEGEEVSLLQHIVLSHHGKKEWGSPVQPLVLEAEILHQIDMIDAKMNTLSSALSGVKAGEFTERLFSLDNRSFYKPII